MVVADFRPTIRKIRTCVAHCTQLAAALEARHGAAAAAAMLGDTAARQGGPASAPRPVADAAAGAEGGPDGGRGKGLNRVRPHACMHACSRGSVRIGCSTALQGARIQTLMSKGCPARLRTSVAMTEGLPVAPRGSVLPLNPLPP